MRCKIGYNADITLKIGYNAMFTTRIAYSADFLHSQVPRTKRYLLYAQIIANNTDNSLLSITCIFVQFYSNIGGYTLSVYGYNRHVTVCTILYGALTHLL